MKTLKIYFTCDTNQVEELTLDLIKPEILDEDLQETGIVTRTACYWDLDFCEWKPATLILVGCIALTELVDNVTLMKKIRELIDSTGTINYTYTLFEEKGLDCDAV